MRPTRADVNLEALRHNLRVVKRHAEGARVWAVLKADAYGHGAPAVARTLERAHVDGFCVALLEEAVELREAGIVAPILVMGGHYGSAHDEVLVRGLVPVVHDIGQIASFARLVRAGTVTEPVDRAPEGRYGYGAPRRDDVSAPGRGRATGGLPGGACSRVDDAPRLRR